MTNQTKTIDQLNTELELLKTQLKQAKQANRPKTPVTAEIHTAKESGKLSIAIGQGFRKAYLNRDQVTFILDNAEAMQQMIKGL
jgi:hypothetical protein